MKHLTFLHSVVKKRRTFGNITTEGESNSPWEIQDSYEDNTESLGEENDSIRYTSYEYLNNEAGMSKIELSYYFYIIFYVKW